VLIELRTSEGAGGRVAGSYRQRHRPHPKSSSRKALRRHDAGWAPAGQGVG